MGWIAPSPCCRMALRLGKEEFFHKVNVEGGPSLWLVKIHGTGV